jgi:hypothetical protein
MHNHVQHSLDTPCGVNGFRAWTDTEPPSEFMKCPCGWSGLPHYAHRDHVRVTQGRCVDPIAKAVSYVGRGVRPVDAPVDE